MKLSEVTTHNTLQQVAAFPSFREKIKDEDQAEAERIFKKVMIALTKVVDVPFTRSPDGRWTAHAEKYEVGVWHPSKKTGWITHVSVTDDISGYKIGNKAWSALYQAGLINPDDKAPEHQSLNATDIFVSAWTKGEASR